MNAVQYIQYHLDDAIQMLLDDKKSKTECAIFLMKFKERLYGKEHVIVDVEMREVDRPTDIPYLEQESSKLENNS